MSSDLVGKNDLPIPTAEQSAGYLDIARREAAGNLVVLSRLYRDRALSETASTTTIKEAAEFNYKLSGLASKQAAAQPGMGGFRVSFNFNSGKPAAAAGITIDATPEPETLPEPPAHVLAMQLTNDLMAELE